MENSILTFKYSSGFLLLIFVFAVGVSYYFYRKQDLRKNLYHKILLVSRSVAIFLLCLLLIEPITKSFINVSEKARLILLIDDSESIRLSNSFDSTAFVQKTREYKNTKEREGFEVEMRTLNKGIIDSVQFNGRYTNLQASLSEIQEDYSGANLKSVVVFSDGLVNQGLNLTNQVFPFSVHAVGLGDTLAKKDLQIKELKYNREVNKDNYFFIEAHVLAENFSSETITIELLESGEVLESKTVNLNSNTELVKNRFKLFAEEEGVRVFTIKVNPKEEEFNKENNSQKAFVKIRERTRKVLILAQAPHPDIKVFTNALDKNQTIDADVYFPFLNRKIKLSDYSMVVLFHANEYKGNTLNYVSDIQKAGLPVLFTYSAGGNINTFNGFQNVLSEQPKNGNDQIHASVNRSFTKFNVQEIDLNFLEEAPPLQIQFSDFKQISSSEVLLNQQIGNLSTQKPLLVVARNKAVLLGEGYFRWSIFEGMNNQSSENIETLFSKLIQYLVSKADQDQFNVYPVKSTYKIYQSPEFFIEIYNSLLEPVYGKEVSFKLFNSENELIEQLKINTVTGKSRYNLSSLEEGVYRFTASVSIDNKIYSEEGFFMVENSLLEQENLVANYDILKQIAENNSGAFVSFTEFNTSVFDVSSTEKIHTQERELSAIHLKLLAIILLICLFFEWFIRKRLTGKP